MKKLALFAAFIALSFAVLSCTKETPTGGNNSNNNQWEAEGNGAPVNATDIATDIVTFRSALPVCTAGICPAKSITRNSSFQVLRLAHSVSRAGSKPDGLPALMKLNGGMVG